MSGIHVENEYLVEQVDEGGEVSRTTAEEGGRSSSVFNEIPDPRNVPDVVLMAGAFGGDAGHRVALVGQFPVSVDCVVSAASQLSANRCLPRARDTFDQVVAASHSGSLAFRAARSNARVLMLRSGRHKAACFRLSVTSGRPLLKIE